MKRILIKYKKLTPDILDLLVKKYPDGYNDSDIVTFRNAKDELIEAVEVKTDDTIYLVKVSEKLEQRMDTFLDEDEDEIQIDEVKPSEVDLEDENL